jgi:predicted HTH transcriptional regulator
MAKQPTAEELKHFACVISSFIREKGFITNRILREITGIGYDQAIQIFNLLINKQLIKRVGTTTSTRYVCFEKKDVEKKLQS